MRTAGAAVLREGPPMSPHMRLVMTVADDHLGSNVADGGSTDDVFAQLCSAMNLPSFCFVPKEACSSSLVCLV